jgi:MFS family permease
MTNRPASSKIFFGWWIVLASSVIGFLGVGIANSGLSVLFKPIAEELGLSRAAASWASGIQALGQGIAGLVGGRTTDRYGPRRIIIIGIVLLVIGLAAMYFVNSLWTYLIAWGLLVGIGFSFGCTFVTDIAIVRWFVKKSGIAINLKFAVQSLSGLLLLPVIAWLTTSQGWRFTGVATAAIIAIVCLPMAWFLIKPHPPEYYGLTPDGIPPTPVELKPEIPGDRRHDTEVSFTFKETLKTPAYWLLILISYLTGAAAPILNVHCVPFLTDRGISPVQAAGIMAIILTSGIPARLISGYLLDRVKTGNLRFMIAAGFLLQASGTAIFLLAGNNVSIYIWFLLFGIGNGIYQGVLIPLWARYFGRKAYGAILGSTMTVHMPIALVAPIYVGWIYDRFGSYLSVIIALAVFSALAGVIASFITPPRKLPDRNSRLYGTN